LSLLFLHAIIFVACYTWRYKHAFGSYRD